MFIIIVFWLGTDRSSLLLFFVPALLLSMLTPFFLPSSSVFYLTSFLLFSCASVWENTRTWVPYFLSPYWMVPSFFAETTWSKWSKSRRVASEKLTIIIIVILFFFFGPRGAFELLYSCLNCIAEHKADQLCISNGPGSKGVTHVK